MQVQANLHVYIIETVRRLATSYVHMHIRCSFSIVLYQHQAQFVRYFNIKSTILASSGFEEGTTSSLLPQEFQCDFLGIPINWLVMVQKQNGLVSANAETEMPRPLILRADAPSVENANESSDRHMLMVISIPTRRFAPVRVSHGTTKIGGSRKTLIYCRESSCVSTWFAPAMSSIWARCPWCLNVTCSLVLWPPKPRQGEID